MIAAWRVPQEEKKTDYISREAAINAVFEALADGRAVFPALNNLPAADVREVVLCRECKYYNDETCDRWSDGTYLKPNDFCSRAARI